ncbi:Kinetochore protein mis13 [Termitomyces sp. J132]|nr:Kinetochore protein mis13 [Termitomyces sp. J132]
MLLNNATNKRKASDDEANAETNEAMSTGSMTATSNPLVNASKKAKRESKTGALKRKLANAEEAPGGLFIVRTQIPPSSSLPAPAPITKPPTKKFKSSQPSQSQPSTFKPSSLSLLRSQSATGTRFNTPDADPALDAAVRAMDKEDETPQIQRNKRLRAGAMAAFSSGGSDTPTDTGMVVDPVTPPRRPGQSAPGSSRRKSSVGGRGKRISSSFEATGVITQPHNSVADTSFYKHIDSDLPDSDRVRQLLIWCSARVAASPPSSSPSSSSSSPTDPPLPKLSAEAEAVLKATQEDILRKLAQRRVNLSLFSGDSDVNLNVNLAENKQNVTNRTWEGVYLGHIKSAEKEEEAWKKVSSAYDAYARRVRSNIEKRRVDLGLPIPSTSPSTGTEPSTATPSAKAQGKQRAPNPDSRPLPTFSQGYNIDVEMEEEIEATSTKQKQAEAEAEMEADKVLNQRMKDVEFKLDHLYVMASQARQTTEVAQMALDARFEVLARALDARHPSLPMFSSSSTTGETPANVLERYMSTGAGGGMERRGVNKDREEADEALALLRALARVDAARPPAQVGDAVRRAVREVQRVGDPSERRITEVPMGTGGVGLTPRKMPGTPRRGTTPGR